MTSSTSETPPLRSFSKCRLRRMSCPTWQVDLRDSHGNICDRDINLLRDAAPAKLWTELRAAALREWADWCQCHELSDFGRSTSVTATGTSATETSTFFETPPLRSFGQNCGRLRCESGQIGASAVSSRTLAGRPLQEQGRTQRRQHRRQQQLLTPQERQP